tara:strand:- start:389 stop:625 length:237 start_codon:yes stop_codon:yes gene_type:complete
MKPMAWKAKNFPGLLQMKQRLHTQFFQFKIMLHRVQWVQTFQAFPFNAWASFGQMKRDRFIDIAILLWVVQQPDTFTR